MASYVNLHSQLASIMEVLANAAVAEICQLVDDSFAGLRLEISRSRRENLALKSRLRLMEVRSGQQSHKKPALPLVVTCPRRDHCVGEDDPVSSEQNVKSSTVENTDNQQSKLVDVAEVVVMDQDMNVAKQSVKPEDTAVKREPMEEELTSCRVLLDHRTAAPNCSSGPQSLSPGAESCLSLSGETQISRDHEPAHFENPQFARLEAQQWEEKEGAEEVGTLALYCHPAEQSLRKTTASTQEEDKHVYVVYPRDSVSAQSSSKAPDIETVELDLSNHSGVKDADWRGEAMSTPVKLAAEPSWSDAFRRQSSSVSAGKNEFLSSSKFTGTVRLHIESETPEMNNSWLDSSSFDDLFSSPEVARSLTTPNKQSKSMEEPLKPSSSSLLSRGSNPGNFSTSDSPAVSSFSNTSNESSSTDRVHSCQQCGRCFSSSRDLVVHQRSHVGERIYHCHLCKKPFIHPHQLKTHQRVHTGEKPFSCTQCGKRFSQSSHIKRHMSVHTGEKRYSCSLCGKRFSQACSLKVHQAVHTGERPYSCTKCGKSFSVLGNLVRHQSVHISK